MAGVDRDNDDLEGVSPENRDTILRFRQFSASMMGLNGQLLALHLLIEATAEDCLKALLPNPKAVLDRDMSFSNKLSMVEAFLPPLERTRAVFGVVRALNTARNLVAHGADEPKISQAIVKLSALSGSSLNFREYLDAPLIQRLTAIAIHSCGYLLGRTEAITGVKPKSQIGVEQ